MEAEAYADFLTDLQETIAQPKKEEGVAEAEMVEDGGDEFSVGEMREELERLRTDGAKQPAGNAGDGKAVLPALIPEVPEGGLMVSEAMHRLVDTVVSPTSKRRCGFFGMGGIGKTTTSAWLCRQDAVRSGFEAICWVALGQTPNIVAQQQQLFAQLTGQLLALDLSAEEKLQELKAELPRQA